MAKDKENEMLEKLRQRIRRAAANKKPGTQNTPSMIEEMGGRAKIGRPKILDAFKGSEDQVKPSMMRGKMTTAEMEAKMKKKAAENKEIDATRKRARKAAEKPRTTKQVKPSWMKEIESKTGKPIGASLTVVKESVTVSPLQRKKKQQKRKRHRLRSSQQQRLKKISLKVSHVLLLKQSVWVKTTSLTKLARNLLPLQKKNCLSLVCHCVST